MLKNNLGYPRVGAQRQLKKACEQYWAKKITENDLYKTANSVEDDGWRTQVDAKIDLIPIGDFSLYDQVLDMALLLGAIPDRYSELLKLLPSSKQENGAGAAIQADPVQSKQTDPKGTSDFSETDLYFAMARGYQQNQLDITPMEMTKWFDTNYHYIVPEFKRSQQFKLFSNSLFLKFTRAKTVMKGQTPKPVLIGPVSFLLLEKEKGEGFHRLSLLNRVLPIYFEIFTQLSKLGAEWIQLDEPYLALDLTKDAKEAYQ